MTNEHTDLATELGRLAAGRKIKIATAESCTGGGVAEAITRVPGSSGWFEYGFITYSNAAKSRILGVKAKSLLQFGAVSQEVVSAMAQGARTQANADYAVAVSGIAGPGGSTPTKPVGLVWFAWAGPEGVPLCAHHVFSGSREQVRQQAVTLALRQLCEQIHKTTV